MIQRIHGEIGADLACVVLAAHVISVNQQSGDEEVEEGSRRDFLSKAYFHSYL
jgi:hypothetical protein